MYLWKVIVSAKKQWMPEYLDMGFVTVADTPDGAIQQVMDEYDLEGVIIQKVRAKKVEKGILPIDVKEYR